MRENKPSPWGSIKKLQGLGYHLVGYRYSRVWKRVQISTDLHPFFIAEREGFEPPEPLSSTVFKTAAIDHSAISPRVEVLTL